MEKRIILLNGPSSSGKSTLARALQRLIREREGIEYAIVSIDDFMKISTGEVIYEDDVFEISGDMCRGALERLETAPGVIVDHVITSPRIYHQFRALLRQYPQLLVHVDCPAEELRRREAARGDRHPGSAADSARYLYPADGYDLTVDTFAHTAADCAAQIYEAGCRRTEESPLKLPAPLLWQAAQRGIFGAYREYERGGIADALFVYLSGAPDSASIAALRGFTGRPLVCLTDAWEDFITARWPRAQVFHRWLMKPACRFRFPEADPLPDGYAVGPMDEAAFARHPFSHGENYASYAAFQADGSGAVVTWEGEIAASASSFLSLDGEVELDVSTRDAHRGKGLASACIEAMLRDCMARGIRVHWDAQNETSRHMAEKFGFAPGTEYKVYWLPRAELTEEA